MSASLRVGARLRAMVEARLGDGLDAGEIAEIAGAARGPRQLRAVLARYGSAFTVEGARAFVDHAIASGDRPLAESALLHAKSREAIEAAGAVVAALTAELEALEAANTRKHAQLEALDRTLGARIASTEKAGTVWLGLGALKIALGGTISIPLLIGKGVWDCWTARDYRSDRERLQAQKGQLERRLGDFARAKSAAEGRLAKLERRAEALLAAGLGSLATGRAPGDGSSAPGKGSGEVAGSSTAPRALAGSSASEVASGKGSGAVAGSSTAPRALAGSSASEVASGKGSGEVGGSSTASRALAGSSASTGRGASRLVDLRARADREQALAANLRDQVSILRELRDDAAGIGVDLDRVIADLEALVDRAEAALLATRTLLAKLTEVALGDQPIAARAAGTFLATNVAEGTIGIPRTPRRPDRPATSFAAALAPDGRFHVVPYEAAVSRAMSRGSSVHAEDLADLARRGFKSIVDLRAETPGEAQAAARAGLAHLRIPIPDNTAPTHAQMQAFLDFARKPENQPVYVHCEAGIGRTGVAVACYRMAIEGWPLERALAEAEHYFLCVPEQKAFLADFAARQR